MNGNYRLSGVARMHERPIADLVDALRQLGAKITYLGKEGFPPLEIKPASINITNKHSLAVKGDASSQFLSGLLMALPITEKPSTIHVVGNLISRPYVELTLGQMKHFGMQVECHDYIRFELPGKQFYHSPGEINVEGDASSASYFLAAGAIGTGPVRVQGVGSYSLQGDVRFTEVLQKMGAQITLGNNWIESRRLTSNQVNKPLNAIDIDCNHIPDAAMTIAVTALFADGISTLRNIASWRLKETDRLYAMAKELRKLGAKVEEGNDYLRIQPPAKKITSHAAIDTYDDHRMAMCFSLAAFGAPVRINDPDCVSKNFSRLFLKNLPRSPILS